MRAFPAWPVRELTTDVDLCAWLDVTPEHLAWFANVYSRESARPRGPLWHYSYQWIRKRSGGWLAPQDLGLHPVAAEARSAPRAAEAALRGGGGLHVRPRLDDHSRR